MLRLPHAVVGPCHGVIGISGERAFVPDFGVVITPEFAARVADQVRYVGIVVVVESAQRRDSRFVLAFLVNERIGGFIAGDEVFNRTASILLGV